MLTCYTCRARAICQQKYKYPAIVADLIVTNLQYFSIGPENLLNCCCPQGIRAHVIHEYTFKMAPRLIHTFCTLRIYKHYIDHNQTFTLTFRSLSEIFVTSSQEVVYSSSGSCHGSDVTWQEIGPMCVSVYSIAALVPVHRTPSLLSDVHCFHNPSGTSLRLPIQDCRV